MNWGHDAVLSIQQAQQFGILAKQKLVIPYQIPFLAKEVGAQVMEGVYAATDFWWTLEDKYPLAKMFVEAFQKKYGYKPEWGANNAYMQFALWADARGARRHLLSAGRHQGARGRQQERLHRRRGLFPRRRSPARPAGGHRARQEARRHEEPGGLLGGAWKSCPANR